ncbi:Hypothetical predicted protein [Cloeon dipterum]|uniref:alpha-1,2-Mannosidase n=1 Tax=Cloeon dipterum TaxID=197152 RepID=A0A8S1C6L1_9INSE|nr:Hypothetical predicted protein [Cloeon dipterum]
MNPNKYVTLNLSNLADPTVKPRRSLWRLWNQLSRFQRSLLYVGFASAVLMMIYFWPIVVSQGGEPLVISVETLPSPQPAVDVGVFKNTEIDGLDTGNKEEQQGEAALEAENEIRDHGAPPNEPQVEEPMSQKAVRFKGPITERQKAVTAAMQHAWKGYKEFAWGHDHLKPISGAYHDWFFLGLTIVDSIDTLYIMNLKNEYMEAKKWVEKSLRFDRNQDVNLFEVTIRVLGGLLSSYHLTGEKIFLAKAMDLGERLLPCFESPSGVPFSDINLGNHKAHSPKWSPDSSTSEVTTIQLEFRDLSSSTGDPRFEEAVSKVSEHVHKLPKTDGLVPIFINANTGQFRVYSTITLGARGDSYYEYLLKQWIQTGKSIEYLRNDYMEAIEGVMKLLIKRTSKSSLLFIGELQSGARDFKPKMDHLTCYLPGTLALGVHNGMPKEHMKLAEDLLWTCYQTYAQTPTFLAPEITYFQIQDANAADLHIKSNDAHNLLRPEFIESLWYMYQLTGNKTFQDWGWTIFQAFEKYTKVTNGYTSINNVKSPSNVKPKDMMESFFLSETLKYFYLLFSDNPKLIDLDEYVFNSEAHPLPISKS